MAKKETSEENVRNYLDGLSDYLEEDDVKPQILQKHIDYLSALKLALGSYGSIPQYDRLLKDLSAIKNGQYGKIPTALDHLGRIKPEILAKVRTATQADKTLSGRIDPSSVKRRIFTEKARLTSERGYAQPKY